MLKIGQIEIRSPLRSYVNKISVFECSDPIDCKHRLIPSACTYLSYNHKDIPDYFLDGQGIPSERLQITGPKTNQHIHVEYGNELLQILIEFTPSGFYYLFHDSPANYLNEPVNLSHFEQLETSDVLTQRLLANSNPEIHVSILQDYLLELSFRALPFCSYIEEAIRIMHSEIGNFRVRDIAEVINKSERQFNRQFIKIVGVSPKLYSKILQLHYVINLMNLKEYSSIKEISYSANFYDPSHFDNRFKDLVGLTPFEFLVSKEHNALKYFTDLAKPRNI